MNSKSVKLAEIYDVMEEMLASGGTVNFNPRGTSMLPTLHNDGDRDNQWYLEKNVPQDAIIGKVIQIQRKGRIISVDDPVYKAYVRIWVFIRPLRHIVIGGTRKIKSKIKSLVFQKKE